VLDQHDFAASVTSVAQFAECPRRYYIERYLGWPGNGRQTLRTVDEDDEDQEIGASEFGRQVHALLAGQVVEEPAPEAQKLIAAFHASELGRRAARATRIEREFDFLIEIEDIVLRGQIDLWFEEAGELVLVDYKTDEIKTRDTIVRAHFYAPQLRLYALALERIAGRTPARAYVYFLRPDVAVPVSLERSLIDDPEALVRDFREAQAGVSFPLREGEHCARCPYFRGICPAGTSGAQTVHPPAVDEEDLTVDRSR